MVDSFEKTYLAQRSEKFTDKLPRYRIFFKSDSKNIFTTTFSFLNLEVLNSKNGIWVSQFACFQNANFVLQESDKQNNSVGRSPQNRPIYGKWELRGARTPFLLCSPHRFEKAVVLHKFCGNPCFNQFIFRFASANFASKFASRDRNVISKNLETFKFVHQMTGAGTE